MQKSELELRGKIGHNSKIRHELINFPDLAFDYDVIEKKVTIIKITEKDKEWGEASYLDLTIDECLAILVALKRFTDTYKIIT